MVTPNKKAHQQQIIDKVGGYLEGAKNGKKVITNDASLGGLAKGKKHIEGGIKGINKSTNQSVEIEAGEPVINERSANMNTTHTFNGQELTNKEILNDINTTAGCAEIKAAGGEIAKPIVYTGGQVVITAKALDDTTTKEFDGKQMTNQEILSHINEQDGGLSFAKGGNMPGTLTCSGKMYNFGGEMQDDYTIAKSCGCRHSKPVADRADFKVGEIKNNETFDELYNLEITPQETPENIATAFDAENSDYFKNQNNIVAEEENFAKGGSIISFGKNKLKFKAYNVPVTAPAHDTHKKMVLVKDGEIVKIVKFGLRGMQDFTQHSDEQRRKNYLTRSAGIVDGKGLPTKDNPLSANYWSRRILWDSGEDIIKPIYVDEMVVLEDGGPISEIIAKDGTTILPQEGVLYSHNKSNKLEYYKKNNEYAFRVYDAEENPVKDYTRNQYKKRNNDEVLMNYNQFVNYLYTELYLDDKQYEMYNNGGKINVIPKEIFLQIFPKMWDGFDKQERINLLKGYGISNENLYSKYAADKFDKLPTEIQEELYAFFAYRGNELTNEMSEDEKQEIINAVTKMDNGGPIPNPKLEAIKKDFTFLVGLQRDKENKQSNQWDINLFKSSFYNKVNNLSTEDKIAIFDYIEATETKYKKQGILQKSVFTENHKIWKLKPQLQEGNENNFILNFLKNTTSKDWEKTAELNNLDEVKQTIKNNYLLAEDVNIVPINFGSKNDVYFLNEDKIVTDFKAVENGVGRFDVYTLNIDAINRMEQQLRNQETLHSLTQSRSAVIGESSNIETKTTTPFHDIKEGDYVQVFTGTKKEDEGLVTFKYGKHYLNLDNDSKRKYNYGYSYYIISKPQTTNEKPQTRNEKKLKLSDIPAIVKEFMPLAQQKAIVDSNEHWEVIKCLEKTLWQVPEMYATEDTPTKDKMVYLHYFTSSSDWYIVELDKQNKEGFGYVKMQDEEWGYISIEEMLEITGLNAVQLDFFFEPIPFGELFKEEEINITQNNNETQQVYDSLIAFTTNSIDAPLTATKYAEFLENEENNNHNENVLLIAEATKNATLIQAAKYLVKEADKLGYVDADLRNLSNRINDIIFWKKPKQNTVTASASKTKYAYQSGDKVVFFGTAGKIVNSVIEAPSTTQENGILIWKTKNGYKPENELLPAVTSARKQSVGSGYKMFKGLGGGSEYVVEFADGDTFKTSRADNREQAIDLAMRHRLYTLKDYPKSDSLEQAIKNVEDAIANEKMQSTIQQPTTPSSPNLMDFLFEKVKEKANSLNHDLFNAWWVETFILSQGNKAAGEDLIKMLKLPANADTLQIYNAAKNKMESTTQQETVNSKPETKSQTQELSIVNSQLSTKTKLQQHNINNQIRALLNEKGTDHTKYSAEEISLLKLYEGAGGLAKQGQTGARLFDQFFTPMDIIAKMWGLALQYGFSFPNSNILEPSVGSGRFVSFVPHNSNCNVVAYDVDETSYKLCKVLYPNFDIRFGSFEQMFFNGNRHIGLAGVQQFFDLVITNPPYRDYVSEYAPLGEKTATGATTFEMYFIMRGVDVLKPGGLLIMIVPNTFLSNDNKYNDFKEKLAKKADLIDAYRLPNGVFGNTDVGTDIIVLKKK